jgi:hypothetical protein
LCLFLLLGFVTIYFSGMASLAPRPTPNLEDQELHFVRLLPFDLCGMGGCTSSLGSYYHNSSGPSAVFSLVLRYQGWKNLGRLYICTSVKMEGCWIWSCHSNANLHCVTTQKIEMFMEGWAYEVPMLVLILSHINPVRTLILNFLVLISNICLLHMPRFCKQCFPLGYAQSLAHFFSLSFVQLVPFILSVLISSP